VHIVSKTARWPNAGLDLGLVFVHITETSLKSSTVICYNIIKLTNLLTYLSLILSSVYIVLNL